MALNNQNFIKWGLFSLVLLVLLRLPFLSQPLVGEEGNFAMIVTGYDGPNIPSTKVGLAREIDRNCLLVIGRIDEQGDTLARPGRNIVPYCFLGLVIKPVVSKIDVKEFSFDEKSILIRAVFLCLSSFGFISLTILSCLVAKTLPKSQVIFPFLILFYFTTNHLALGASIQPQLDGAFGFLLLANSMLFAYLGSQKESRLFLRFLLNFFAGFLVAFCKNEWPLTFLASICFVLAIHFVLSIVAPSKYRANLFKSSSEKYHICLALFLGCIAGMGICYAFSPSDYMAGFGLMKGIHGSRSSHVKIFFKSLYFNIQILTPVLVVLLFGVWAVYKNWQNLFKEQIALLIFYIWAWGVLVGFLQSGWGGDGFPRYYFPPLLVGGTFLITQLPGILRLNLSEKKFKVATIGILVVIVFNYSGIFKKYLNHESITVPANYLEVKEAIKGAAEINRRDPFGVMFHQSAMRYYFPDINFIAVDIGRDGALQWPLPNKKYYLVL